MDMWLTVIGDYGITAAIAFYLLHRVEKKLDLLIQVVQTRETHFYSKDTSVTNETTPTHLSS